MERSPVVGTPRPMRGQPIAADTPPRRSRLALPLMGLGIMLLIGSVVVVGVVLNPLSHANVPPPGANATRLDQRAVAVAYVDVEGGVRSLFPTQPGRVRELPVPEGKDVPKGTLLLQLDDDLQMADLASADLALDLAQERLLQALKLDETRALKIEGQQLAIVAAREKVRAAELQAKRIERLFKDGVKGGSEDVGSAKALVAEGNALVKVEQTKLSQLRSMSPASAVRMAEIDVQSKQKQLSKAQLAVDECQVRAPCAGQILRTLVNVGELLGPASKGPALQFCPSGGRIVRAEVEQEFASRVRIGQKATVQDDITGTGEWHGKVIGISHWYTQRRIVLLEPGQFNDSRTLEVIIRLKDQPGQAPLRINQRLRVKLDGAD